MIRSEAPGTRDSSPVGALGDALFLVWGPPSHGPRSRVFARALGIDVEFVWSTHRRGILVAPYKYVAAAIQTLRLLMRRRPNLVFVQSPPSLAVLFVRLYCTAADARFVVDAHSAAMQSAIWTRPLWLQRHLARQAVTTIVTNERFARIVRSQGAHAVVIRDVPTTFPAEATFPVEGSFNVMVVNTFAPDEPLPAVLEAASGLSGVTLYVTGDADRAGKRSRVAVPPNVRFTGFLPDDTYYALMRGSQVVMCLTTRDDTMQRGACEALSMGKPIITSRWPLLQSYFHKGSVCVENSPEGIRAGVLEMMRDHGRYEAEIEQLQIEQQEEWRTGVASLRALLGGALESNEVDRREAG